jgi:hypothetical protein
MVCGDVSIFAAANFWPLNFGGRDIVCVIDILNACFPSVGGATFERGGYSYLSI